MTTPPVGTRMIVKKSYSASSKGENTWAGTIVEVAPRHPNTVSHERRSPGRSFVTVKVIERVVKSSYQGADTSPYWIGFRYNSSAGVAHAPLDCLEIQGTFGQCPRCEKDWIIEHDYLCEGCRYGWTT